MKTLSGRHKNEQINHSKAQMMIKINLSGILSK